MMEDKELYDRARGCARELIASRYDRKYVWACLKEFYKEKLG